MKLTGKCKEDFFKVFGVDDEDINISIQYFNNKTIVEKNALIIEFFDSVGIKVLIDTLHFQNWFFYKIKNNINII